ncbi:hypothetical protein EOL94_03330 [bacterium]|nr:hypothetical protein [bacterium]
MLIFRVTLWRNDLETPIFAIFDGADKLISSRRLDRVARYFNENNFIDIGEIENYIAPIGNCPIENCSLSNEWFPRFVEEIERDKKINSMEKESIFESF